MVEPGLVVDRAAHGERQVEPGRHPARDDVGVDAPTTPRPASLADLDLVAVAEEVVVERLELDLRHQRVRRRCRTCRVHVREVGDVEEVVGHPRRRRRPRVDAGVDAAVRRVVVRGDVGMRRGRLAEAEPHQAVALGDVERRQVRPRRHGRAVAGRRHATQRPPSPNVQPWYGHDRQPSSTVPSDSGASRCGQRSGAATTSPSGARHTHESLAEQRDASGAGARASVGDSARRT